MKDDKFIYMLMEAVLGGELFAYMQVSAAGRAFILYASGKPLPSPH
jgi:hypothetical protein